MERYSEYKPSGVEWIGGIPRHWRLSSLGFHTMKIGSGSTPRGGSEVYVEKGIPFIRSQNVHFDGLKLEDVSYIDREIHESMGGSKVLDGDVLLNITGGSIGRCCVVNHIDMEMNVNQHVSIIRTKSTLDNRYLNFLLSSDLGQTQVFYNVTGGNRDGLTIEGIRSFKVTLPPLPEQEEIVRYLDTKTQEIDQLVSITQKKIDLLKERRTSIINEVVTKGLNPNVELKDSGVEWIGEIPSHWEIMKVKHLIDPENGIKIGPFGSSLKLDTLSEDGVKVYGQSNVINDDFNIGHRHIPVERFENEFKQYEVFEGDVLMTMMGTTGKSKIFRSEYKRGILDSHLLRLRFDSSKFRSELFVTVLHECEYVLNQIRVSSKGSIMEGLNSSIVKELFVLTPPLSEQEEIVRYLDTKSQEIDQLVSIEEKRIETLKEYRQSLISDVVTGKVKVTSTEPIYQEG